MFKVLKLSTHRGLGKTINHGRQSVQSNFSGQPGRDCSGADAQPADSCLAGSNFTQPDSHDWQHPHRARRTRIWLLIHLGVAGTVPGR